MNKIEYLQSLIDSTKKTEYGEFLSVKESRNMKTQLGMFIRNEFGSSSEYLTDLTNMIPSGGIVYKIELNGFIQAIMANIGLFKEGQETSQSVRAEKQEKVKVKVQSAPSIFIVHGHDEAMKQSVARVIEKIGLSPVILHEKPSQGRTIIEKFTEYSDVSFAIVLLSPDDLAFPRDQTANDARPRSRQNVIFELGFFIGKLGRDRVFALYEEAKNFEMPSDYAGVLYVPYDNAGRWQFDLVKELKSCGFDIDANKLVG